jgi:aminodeoxychorismate synthase component I
MVRRAKEYIAAGDIYQVNLSQKFRADWSGDALEFYGALRHCSPAPYAAFIEMEGRALLSSSPECFLRMSGRRIRTRPIKGTRPRLPDPQADERSALDLITSEKEIAELVMITDLERNDLGQVCEYGSVRATDLLKLERFEQVFHLVSTVDGRLRADVDHIAALRACFPGGSITGAPKKRAMEIIAELEPSPRGVYTGAMGWFGFNGESQFNIAIRTVVMEEGTAHFHVGAGIVADSDPEAEYEETLHKAAGIFSAAEFLRTMRKRDSQAAC